MILFHTTSSRRTDLNSMFYDGGNLYGTDGHILVVNKAVQLKGIKPNTLLTSPKIKARYRTHSTRDGLTTIASEDFYTNNDAQWFDYKRMLHNGERHAVASGFGLIASMYLCAKTTPLMFDFVMLAAKLKALDSEAGCIDSFEILDSKVRFDNKAVTIVVTAMTDYVK